MNCLIIHALSVLIFTLAMMVISFGREMFMNYSIKMELMDGKL